MASSSIQERLVVGSKGHRKQEIPDIHVKYIVLCNDIEAPKALDI